MTENNENDTRHGIEKLKGRSNYDEWKVAAKSYLIIKNLYSVIEDDISPKDSPQTNARAISEITLLIDNSLFNYIEDSKSAKAVWDNLARAFDDSGVARKVSILSLLVSVKLKNFNSIEKYINTLLLYYNKSKVAGFHIEEQVIASLMLGGLPDEYLPMILGIENSGRELTIDYVKTVLLQGIPDPFESKDDIALNAIHVKEIKERYKGYKGKRSCFKCGDVLHFMVNCPKKSWKCYKCGSTKHFMKNCDVKEEGQKEHSTEDDGGEENEEQDDEEEEVSIAM